MINSFNKSKENVDNDMLWYFILMKILSDFFAHKKTVLTLCGNSFTLFW